jgi:hypothetical protein
MKPKKTFNYEVEAFLTEDEQKQYESDKAQCESTAHSWVTIGNGGHMCSDCGLKVYQKQNA